MNAPRHLNEKWIKASILGTIWAASEIVLGSFLHNLRIPFSGNVLTAIGIIILIAASYKWKEKGIFWRAGVICALLKTMSPSAVIFGPFIAILSEAFLLEFATRILGRTIPGFIIGSILAMSWNLFHKVFKMIVYYGNNIVEVYTNLMLYVEQQLHFQFNAVWTPLLLLLLIQFLFGIFAAVTGIRTGLEAEKNPVLFQMKGSMEDNLFSKKVTNFPYSIRWMTSNILFTIGILVLIGRINFGIWVALVLLIIFTWAIRYKRALKQLVRPRIWIIFLGVTMLTVLVFSQLQPEKTPLTEAILIGIEMNLRAIVLIMGFTVLGTELYNPEIRNWFAKSYFKQVPVAVQLSLESLPVMITNTPDLKAIVKNPTLFVHQIMAFADYRLNELKEQKTSRNNLFIVTGEIGAGKTNCIKEIVEHLQLRQISVSGILAPRVLENGKTTGYDIVDIRSKKSNPFLRTVGNANQDRIGKYFISHVGYKLGLAALQQTDTDLIVIDEIGKLEFDDKGWAYALKAILQNTNQNILLSVRKEILEQLIDKFELHPKSVVDISNDTCQKLLSSIKEQLNPQ